MKSVNSLDLSSKRLNSSGLRQNPENWSESGILVLLRLQTWSKVLIFKSTINQMMSTPTLNAHNMLVRVSDICIVSTLYLKKNKKSWMQI